MFLLLKTSGIVTSSYNLFLKFLIKIFFVIPQVSPNNLKIKEMLLKFKGQERLAHIHELCEVINICQHNNEVDDEISEKVGHGGCGRSQPTISCRQLEVVAKWKHEQDCGAKTSVLTAEEVLAILKRISDEECAILGMDPKHARPDWMIVTCLPVPPLAVRP